MPNRTAHRTVHSHTRLERFRRRLFADPPWSAIPDGQHARFAVSKAIRHAWLWRDVSPGPIAATALWIPFRYGPFAWTVLAALGALASVWFDSSHGHTANKDRAEYRLWMRFMKAWLDAVSKMPEGRRPSIPDREWTSDRDHATTLAIRLISGDDEYAVARKVRHSLSVAYGKPVVFDPQGDGTALIVVRKSDPLATEPELPRHLGNADGIELDARYDAIPIGIDHDNEIAYLDLSAHPHLLMSGQTGSGKSSSAVPMILTCAQAPYVDPLPIEPSPKSFRCLRAAMPVISNPAAALEQIEDERKQMEKRHLVMEELDTSLLRPSARSPFRVIFIDELQNFLDPDIHGDDYVKRFKAALMDILNRGRAVGYFVVGICTNPRKTILTDGIRDQFTMRLTFKVADRVAANLAQGSTPAGYEPHLLPKQPGRCILKSDGHYRLRCWRLWDAKAARVAQTLTRTGQDSFPPPAPGTATSQLPPTNEHFSDEVDDPTESRPRERRRGDAFDLILAAWQTGRDLSVAEVAAETGLPPSTVKYHKPKLPLEVRPNSRYRLIGGR